MSGTRTGRQASTTMTPGVLARVVGVGVMSSVTLVVAATASGAADATAAAPDSPSPAGFAILGIPIATTVWLLAGVLTVLAGLIGASRSARSHLGATGRLLTAGVDDTGFGSDARATKGDALGDRS